MTQEINEQFVRLITENQSMLHAYIRSLLPDADRAGDVLQETNLVLWRRANEFAEGTNFAGWARKIAYYQVLACYRDKRREKLLFDAELVALLAEQSESQVTSYEMKQRLLQGCLAKLSDQSRDLVRRRYAPDGSVKVMAKNLKRTVGSISQALYRIRQLLEECVNQQLTRETGEEI